VESIRRRFALVLISCNAITIKEFFKLKNIDFAKVENGCGKKAVSLSLPGGFQKMIQFFISRLSL